MDATEAAINAEIAASQNTEAKSNIILPEPTEFKEGAKPLTGGITVLEKDKAPTTMESKILAYQATDKIAADICRAIDSKIDKNSHLVILDNETISAIPSYLILNSRKILYKNTYENLFEEARKELASDETGFQPKTTKGVTDAGLLALPGAAARTIIEFSSLFKTEQTIGNSTFVIKPNSIVSSLGSKCKKGKIYYPSMYLLDIRNNKSNLDTLWEDLKFLLENLQTATSYILKFESKGVDELTENQQRILQELKAQNTGTEAFFSELKTVNKENKNALYLMAKAKTVHENLLKEKNAYMLQLERVESGGSFNTTKNLFSSNIKFSGGSIVSYILFNRDSSILSSGTTYYLTPVTKLDPDIPLTNISDKN